MRKALLVLAAAFSLAGSAHAATKLEQGWKTKSFNGGVTVSRQLGSRSALMTPTSAKRSMLSAARWSLSLGKFKASMTSASSAVLSEQRKAGDRDSTFNPVSASVQRANGVEMVTIIKP